METATIPTRTLRTLLREQTHAAHERLEATPLMRAIASGSPSVEEYRDYLERQFHLHAALEGALVPWVSPECHRLRLVKARWLLCDLVTIDATTDCRQVEIPTISSAAEAMGVLYVIEGGTLGLQVVRKRLQRTHPALNAAGRFMRGYGPATGRNWNSYIASLEGLPGTAWPLAIDAGIRTFAAFHRAFQDSSH